MTAGILLSIFVITFPLIIRVLISVEKRISPEPDEPQHAPKTNAEDKHLHPVG